MTVSVNGSSGLASRDTWKDPKLLAEIRVKLRQDLRYLTFYLSPNMLNFRESPEWFREAFGLAPQDSQEMVEELFGAGLWVRDLKGRVQTHQPRLGLGDRGGEQLSAREATTLITQLLNHVSDRDDTCQTTVQTVVTSQEVKREFLSRVGSAIRNLLERSRSAPGETTFSWALITLDTMKALVNEELL